MCAYMYIEAGMIHPYRWYIYTHTCDDESIYHHTHTLNTYRVPSGAAPVRKASVPRWMKLSMGSTFIGLIWFRGGG